VLQYSSCTVQQTMRQQAKDTEQGSNLLSGNNGAQPKVQSGVGCVLFKPVSCQ
jgi:hypothetical protein